jgi:hypothetical protein
MLCHSFVTSNVPIPNVDVNSYLYIDRNCRSPAYISTMSTCLAQRCESVPDAAYGAEYGTSICHRAGVKVTLELPEAYVAAASEYFQWVAESCLKGAPLIPDLKGTRRGV